MTVEIASPTAPSVSVSGTRSPHEPHGWTILTERVAEVTLGDPSHELGELDRVRVVESEAAAQRDDIFLLRVERQVRGGGIAGQKE